LKNAAFGWVLANNHLVWQTISPFGVKMKVDTGRKKYLAGRPRTGRQSQGLASTLPASSGSLTPPPLVCLVRSLERPTAMKSAVKTVRKQMSPSRIQRGLR
jgi:hypothetical protein